MEEQQAPNASETSQRLLETLLAFDFAPAIQRVHTAISAALLSSNQIEDEIIAHAASVLGQIKEELVKLKKDDPIKAKLFTRYQEFSPSINAYLYFIGKVKNPTKLCDEFMPCTKSSGSELIGKLSVLELVSLKPIDDLKVLLSRSEHYAELCDRAQKAGQTQERSMYAALYLYITYCMFSRKNDADKRNDVPAVIEFCYENLSYLRDEKEDISIQLFRVFTLTILVQCMIYADAPLTEIMFGMIHCLSEKEKMLMLLQDEALLSWAKTVFEIQLSCMRQIEQHAEFLSLDSTTRFFLDRVALNEGDRNIPPTFFSTLTNQDFSPFTRKIWVAVANALLGQPTTLDESIEKEAMLIAQLHFLKRRFAKFFFKNSHLSKLGLFTDERAAQKKLLDTLEPLIALLKLYRPFMPNPMRFSFLEGESQPEFTLEPKDADAKTIRKYIKKALRCFDTIQKDPPQMIRVLLLCERALKLNDPMLTPEVKAILVKISQLGIVSRSIVDSLDDELRLLMMCKEMGELAARATHYSDELKKTTLSELEKILYKFLILFAYHQFNQIDSCLTYIEQLEPCLSSLEQPYRHKLSILLYGVKAHMLVQKNNGSCDALSAIQQFLCTCSNRPKNLPPESVHSPWAVWVANITPVVVKKFNVEEFKKQICMAITMSLLSAQMTDEPFLLMNYYLLGSSNLVLFATDPSLENDAGNLIAIFSRLPTVSSSADLRELLELAKKIQDKNLLHAIVYLLMDKTEDKKPFMAVLNDKKNKLKSLHDGFETLAMIFGHSDKALKIQKIKSYLSSVAERLKLKTFSSNGLDYRFALPFFLICKKALEMNKKELTQEVQKILRAYRKAIDPSFVQPTMETNRQEAVVTKATMDKDDVVVSCVTQEIIEETVSLEWKPSAPPLSEVGEVVDNGKWTPCYDLVERQCPQKVKEILGLFDKSFIVGGALRDILLGKKPKDWDLSIIANRDEIKRILVTNSGKLGFSRLDTTHEGHFLYTIYFEDAPDVVIEITSLEKPDGIDEDAFLQSVQEKLDFDVNSMIYDPRRCCLRDPFGAREILQSATPEITHIDWTATIAIRGALLLHKRELKPTQKLLDTFKSLETKRLLETLGAEKTFVKLLYSECAYEALLAMHKQGFLNILFPEAVSMVERVEFKAWVDHFSRTRSAEFRERAKNEFEVVHGEVFGLYRAEIKKIFQEVVQPGLASEFRQRLAAKGIKFQLPKDSPVNSKQSEEKQEKVGQAMLTDPPSADPF